MTAKLATLSELARRHIEVALRGTFGLDEVIPLLDAAVDNGTLASASLNLSVQPVTADTVTVGADVYEFVTAAGNVADDANIAVEIGGSAALTLTALVVAVNATTAGNVHAGINNVADDAPAKANGTEFLFADEVGTQLRVRTADAAGGNLLGANPSIVLAEAITDVADIWLEGNVNMNTLGGAAAAVRPSAVSELTVTAAMITNTKQVDFPFVVAGFNVQVLDSSGLIRGHGADAYTLVNDGLLITFGGGADPDIQATDVVQVTAWA